MPPFTFVEREMGHLPKILWRLLFFAISPPFQERKQKFLPGYNQYTPNSNRLSSNFFLSYYSNLVKSIEKGFSPLWAHVPILHHSWAEA